jgi:hypothetical protein
MTDDFILASNGMQYQNKVIDDMNAVVELFKIEKLDLKRKIEDNAEAIFNKLDNQEFRNFK